MRIRLPFAGAFICLLLLAAYAGLSSLQLNGVINDKALHFLTFFLLTLCFYWVLDASRNRALKSTLVICTGVLSIGSEFVQGWIPDNGREFDVYDIAFNIAGSLTALALSAWYHKRMLERKRKARGYGLVTGDADLDDAERDVELGEGINGQESGIVHHETAPKAVSLEQELDNWDENAPDDEWNETDQQANAAATADGVKPSMSPKPVDGEDTKKRAD